MTRSFPSTAASASSPASPKHSSASPLPIRTKAPPSVATLEEPAAYAQPFCDFLTDNPTVFHAVKAVAADLVSAGYTSLSEREAWKLRKGGKYFVERNGSSLIAFVVGKDYETGNGVAMIAGHVDALTAKLKPISKLDTKAGFVQLGSCHGIATNGALLTTYRRRSVCRRA